MMYVWVNNPTNENSRVDCEAWAWASMLITNSLDLGSFKTLPEYAPKKEEETLPELPTRQAHDLKLGSIP